MKKVKQINQVKVWYEKNRNGEERWVVDNAGETQEFSSFMAADACAQHLSMGEPDLEVVAGNVDSGEVLLKPSSYFDDGTDDESK